MMPDPRSPHPLRVRVCADAAECLGLRPLALVWLLALGCSEGPGTARGADGDTTPAVDPVARVDSAGVEIRTNPSARMRLLAEPRAMTRISGAEDGGDPLFGVASLAFVDDSTIVAGDSGTRSLRFFALTGRPVARVGRSGAGPGEFGGLNHIAVHRDSLFVYDSRWNRISVFAPDRTLARIITFQGAAAGAGPRLHGITPDDRMLTLARGTDGMVWTAVDLEGNVLARLPAIPAPGVPRLAALPPSAAHPTAYRVEPFRPKAGGGRVGEGVGAFVGPVYEIMLYDGRGQLRAVNRVDAEPRVVEEWMIDDLLSRAVGRSPNLEAVVRQAFGQAAIPDRLPALGLARTLMASPVLLTDAGGDMWVREYTLQNEPPVWLVFSETGELRGRIALPHRFELHAVRGSLLLGVQEDEMDVEQIVILRFDGA